MNPQTFKNIREVAKHLAEQGYKETERTIYNRKVELGKKKDGVYTLIQVNRFARDWCTKKDAYDSKLDEDRSRDKSKAETRKLEAQASLAEFELNIKQGKYILREELYLEMASRAAVLQTFLKGMAQSRAGELVALVEGNERKTGELVRELTNEIDKALNEFARTREWTVLFQGTEETEFEELIEDE
jgi:hypothetical protein